MGNETSSDRSHASEIPVMNKQQIVLKSKLRRVVRKRLLKRTKSVDNFDPPIIQKSTETTKFIKESLSNSIIFVCLDEEEIDPIINCMSKEFVKQGVDLIEEGAVGDYFYLIEEGEVIITKHGKELNRCSRGEYFGELSLLYGTRRAATCRTTVATTLWKMHCRTFRHIIASRALNQKKDIIDTLKKVSVMSECDETQLEILANSMTLRTFSSGTDIIQKGEVGEHFYIVKDGTLQVHNIGFGESKCLDKIIKRGSFFGEMALITGHPRAADVTAITDCSVLCMNKEDYDRIMGINQKLTKSMFLEQILTTAPIFARSKLKSSEIDALAELFEERTFPDGGIFIKEGDDIRNPAFCIIVEGYVNILDSNGTIVSLIRGNYFGDQIINCPDEYQSQQTIEFMGYTKLAILRKKSIESVISDMSRLGEPQSFEKKLSEMTLNDINQYRILGVGEIGIVRLATNVKTGTPYALKQISKRRIIDKKLSKNIFREKNILISLANFPFTVDLIGTFQDSKNVYFALNFIPGGELFSTIHSRNSVGKSEKEAQFYTSCILMCIGHLHKRHVCYRNIKTEHVLVDQEGYCILTDFSYAAIVIDKTHTFCGTPEYLAPEVILCKGHNHAVDYWAIGIFLYELLSLSTPFYTNSVGIPEMFKRIVKVKYDFPNNGKFTPQSRSLIRELLVKNPSKRLGCLEEGVKGIRNHVFFQGINWKQLLSKNIKAPWIPSIKGDMDPSFYQQYPERQRKQSQDYVTEEEQHIFSCF